jgi:transcriptional regulator with XRE-family HTH domain/tetratricopeptide (TPR) repeat protein
MTPAGMQPLTLPEDFWNRPAVRESLQRRGEDGSRDIGGIFRLLNGRAGISQSSIGVAVGLEQGYVSKIMSGRRVVASIDVLERVAAGLGMPDSARLLLGLAPRTATWQPDIGPDDGAPETDLMRRRDLLSLTGMAIAAPLLGADTLHQVERIRQGVNDTVSMSAISERGIDDWQQTAIDHARATRHKPPLTHLHELATDLIELQRILTLHHSSSALRDLTRVAAQMAGLMSLTLIKLDERGASLSWARTARIAACEVNEPEVQSWVDAQEAYSHYYSGDYLSAIKVARRAQEVAGRRPTVGAALSAALEARAQAILGRAPETREALKRAEIALTGLPDELLEASALGYNEAQLRFHAGSAYTSLHDTSRAWNAHKRALQIYPQEDYTDRSLIHLDRADCLIYQGDVNGGARRIIDTLTELTDDKKTGIIDVRAKEIAIAIPKGQQRAPAVQELRDMLMLPSTTRRMICP